MLILLILLLPACRATMSYLQVICEQHRLVEQHLDKFAMSADEPSSNTMLKSKEVGAWRGGPAR